MTGCYKKSHCKSYHFSVHYPNQPQKRKSIRAKRSSLYRLLHCAIWLRSQWLKPSYFYL